MRHLLLPLALLLFGCPTGRAGFDDDDSAGDDDDSAWSDDDDTTADDDDTTADDDDTTADDDDATPDDWAATEVMYAHSGTELYSVDPEPPYTVTTVATFFQASGDPAPNITDLAVNHQGEMIGVSTSGVWRIAPQTGEIEPLLDAPDAFFVALTFLADGTLLAGSNGDLFQISLNPPAMEVVSAFPDGWQWDGDMVGLPDGLLYCAVKGLDDPEASLLVYDADAGVVVRTGPTGTSRMFGVAFGAGTLFGFSDGGDILSLDDTTGAATVVSSPGQTFWGAATNPVRWGPIDPIPPG